MPVFDFSDTPVANEHPECTYETFHSTETKASADKPIVVIDNKQKEWAHHALGMFTNPISCRSNCICPPGAEHKCTQRRDIPGSLAFVPSVAGLIIAGEVVQDIAFDRV